MQRYGAPAVVCLIMLCAWQLGAWNRGGFAITPPSIAASNGFNYPVFYEDWSSVSSIDLNNTKKSGYRWYLNGYYPVQSGWWLSQFNTFTATPPQYLRVADNTLFLQPLVWPNTNTPPSNNFGNYIQTCAWDGTTIVGNTFGGSTGGFYIDAVMRFDPAQMSGDCQGCNNISFWLPQGHAPGNWPAIWMAPAEFLNGGSGTAGHVIDTSIFEGWPGGSDSICSNLCAPIIGTHDETQQNSSVPPQYVSDISNTINSNFPGFDFRQPHHYQFLWLTQAKNGGAGLMEWFVDGVAVGQISYSSSGLSNPDLSPSGGDGELSVADHQHFCLFIDPGLNPDQGIHVGTVQIWQ